MENNYPAGLFFNLPHEKAPDFVKGGVAIRPDVFIEWLKQQQTNDKGYVKLQFKVGKEGRGYATLDTYGLTPQQGSQQATSTSEIDYISADDIPFD